MAIISLGENPDVPHTFNTVYFTLKIPYSFWTLVENSGGTKDLSKDFYEDATLNLGTEIANYFKKRYDVEVTKPIFLGGENPDRKKMLRSPINDFYTGYLTIANINPLTRNQILLDYMKEDALTDRNLTEGLESYIRENLKIGNRIDPGTPRGGPSR